MVGTPVVESDSNLERTLNYCRAEMQTFVVPSTSDDPAVAPRAPSTSAAAVLGLASVRPRLSWWLPAGRRRGRWRTRSSSTTGGPAASSRTAASSSRGRSTARARGKRVDWRVRVWTDAGPSDWSEPATFEAGLLDAGRLVGHVDRARRGRAPAAPVSARPGVLRHEFDARRADRGRPASTPPRTASTRRSSTASGSATSS